jgi:hypothetical protein
MMHSLVICVIGYSYFTNSPLEYAHINSPLSLSILYNSDNVMS